MNKTFRIVWSQARNAWAVTHENAASRGKQMTTRRLMRAGLLLAAVLPAPTFALPTGPTVVHGTATINTVGSTQTITNSANAILNWQSFSIGASETTKFIQPSASSAVLNRVLGSNPSQILGQLQSNGKVFLVNPAGIVVGAGAKIDVGGLVASTLNISNEDFLAGRLRFTAGTLAGDVINKGTITTGAGGTVLLAGANVTNEGLIKTPQGQTILAAGQTVQLEELGAPGLKVEITGADGNATNLGQILAEAGDIGVVAAAVKNSGTLDTSSIVREGGRIFLKATQSIQLTETSKVGADGTAGGSITASITENGAKTGFFSAAGELSAQGSQAGGQIAIEAGSTYFDQGLTTVASSSGQGGRIRVDSARAVDAVAGHIFNASGTSGGSLYFDGGTGRVFTSATFLANGTTGQGGKIEMTGNSIGLLNAQLHADGASGGTIHIGGGWQGAGPLRHANETFVSTPTVLSAKGTSGAGGEIVAWSSSFTDFYGTAIATGTPGGRIEISSKEQLTYNGTANAGQGGQVLFDPKNLTVTSSASDSLTWVKKLASNQGTTAGGPLPPVLAQDDSFGSAMALDGDLLAVGATGDDTGGVERGAVHLFTGVGMDYSGLTWQKKLASSSGATSMPALVDGDLFGSAVALDGDRLAVGARADNTGGADRGAVHLFTGVGSNFSGLTWQKKLASSTGATNMPGLTNLDYFGSSLALDGDRLAVGATGDDTGGNGYGAVHLFTGVGTDFSGLTWQKKLASGIGATSMPTWVSSDSFGSALSLDGDKLAVGARQNGTGGVNRGAVHLFTGVGADFGSLTWQKKLASNTGATNMPTLVDLDYFGSALALDGDLLAVGAINDDTGGANRGAVHLFSGVGSDFTGLIWQKKIASSTGATNMPALVNGDNFGGALALDGDRLAVGASMDDTDGINRGAVHLFTGVGSDFSGLTWQKKLASNRGTILGGPTPPVLADSDNFGSALALDGDRLAVGAILDDTGGAERGAVHLFTGVGTDFSGLTWQKKLVSSSGASNMPALVNYDMFGYALALVGDRLAVGAAGDDTGGTSRGAVHLFTGVGADFSGLTWQKKLASSSGATNMPTLVNADNFGRDLALDGDRLAVGAAGDDTGGTSRGAVHLFTGVGADFSGLTWQKKLASSTGATNMPALVNSSSFGFGLALDGDRLAVGAYGDANTGAVHLFTGVGTDFSGLTWQKKLASSTGATNMPALANADMFGSALALDGDLLAVGARGDDYGNVITSDTGAVHLFVGVGTDFSGLVWQSKLASGTGASNMPALGGGDGFGSALALDGDRLAVGAIYDETGGPNRGAVHLLRWPNPATVPTSTYASLSGQSSLLSVTKITDILNTGSSVTLQASNDLTVASAITANNASGNGGALTLQAGRSILINANITTDNGNFTAIANDTLASGVVNADRDAGAANVSMAGGTSINAGSGNIVLAIRDGAGLTNNTAGNVTLGGLTANNWLVYAPNPASVTKNGITSNFRQYNTAYGGTINGTGNGFIYASTANLTVNTTLASGTASHTFGATPTAVWGYSLTGFADSEDNAGNVGVGGTAAFSPVMASSTAVGSYTVGYLNGLSSSRGYGFVAGTGQAYAVNAAPASPASPTPTTTSSSSPVADIVTPLLHTSFVAAASGRAAATPSGQASPLAPVGLLASAQPLPSLDPLATSVTGLPTPTLPGGNIGGVPGYFGAGGASVPSLAASAAVILDASGNVVSPVDMPIEFLNINPAQPPLLQNLRHVPQCSASS